MKVYFVGCHNPNFIALPEYMEKAIVSLGHSLGIFDYRDFIFPGRLREHFPALEKFDIGYLNKRLAEKVLRFRPDVFFMNWGGTILPETLKAIKKGTGCKMVYYLTDYPGGEGVLEKGLALAGYFDYIFAQSSDTIQAYSKAGYKDVRLLPVGCDIEIHKSVELTAAEKKKYASDICFVGSMYPGRLELFEKIAAAGFDIKIYGPGWEKAEMDSPLSGRIIAGNIAPAEWIKIYSAAAISIVYYGQYRKTAQLMNGKPPVTQVGPRTFETLSCGCFVLHEYKKDLELFFRPGIHLDVFYNAAELIDKIQYYLKSEQQRKQIAAEGMKEAHKKHKYTDRILSLLEMIK